MKAEPQALHPRALLPDTPLTGQGVRVLLLGDDLPPGIDFGGRLRDFDAGKSALSSSPSHALRVASICGEGEEAAALPSGPLGIAPRVTLFHVSHAGLDVAQIGERLAEVARTAGRPHLLGIAWSAREDHHLAHIGRALVADWADVHELAIATLAAVGHDGPGQVRFPASSEHVLAVGVCSTQGAPTHYCGSDPGRRKPELLLTDAAYLARTQADGLGTLNGSSGAVAAACGIGALCCEWLLRRGVEPTPALVRAALLAAADPIAGSHSRALAGHGIASNPAGFAFQRAVPADGFCRMRLVASRQQVRVALSVRSHPRPKAWSVHRPLLLAAVRDVAGQALGSVEGLMWAVLDVATVPGQVLHLDVHLRGGAQSLAVIGFGAELEASARVGSAASDASVHVGRHKSGPRVLGLSASHDAAACIMRGGVVEVAIPLERLTRVTHDGAGYLSTARAAEYCLESLGIVKSDIDLFAFNAQPLLPGWVGLSQPLAAREFDLFDPFADDAVYVSHHLAHAFAAFSASGYQEALVLVCDGSGGSTAGEDDLLLRGSGLKAYLSAPVQKRPGLHVVSAYHFSERGFRLVFREQAESFNVRCGSSSLGEAYAAVSAYLFGSWHASGKLMGLAPYGSPEAYGPSLLEPGADGLLRFSSAWKLAERASAALPDPMLHRHLAARIQADFETALLQRVHLALEKAPARYVVFTGGLALNSAFNERLARQLGVGRAFFYPASHDGGVAVGAAAAATYLAEGRHCGARSASHDYLGHAYSEQDIALALMARERQINVSVASLEAVADRLSEGAAVGWYEGACEFGPRALGHRSILADPRRRESWVRVNREVKYREDFRPFAPVVPIESASRFFELEEASPFMLRVVRVRSEFREKLGAVCHVDGTARVQTVDAETQPRLHALLQRVGERIGLPVLLNTSFNRRGEPLVETPLQAIDMMLASGLDAVVLGERLVTPWMPPEVTAEHAVCVAPGLSAVLTGSMLGTEAILQGSHRDSQRVPPDVARVLQASGTQTVGGIIQALGLNQRQSDILAWLTALHRQAFVNVCHVQPRPAE